MSKLGKMSKLDRMSTAGEPLADRERVAGVAIPYAVTLHVRDACLCLHIQRAARTTARLFDDALRPLGLTNGQFSLLMALNRPDAPTLGAVAALLAMDRTTLTAALKPLRARGLATITIDADDRRGRRLALTPAGIGVLTQALPVWTRTHALLDERLEDPDRLRRDLRALT